ncbi:MAG TPA: zinc ribbon domain-containing protein [Anaerolineales bacterium]|nr:zinc ribbon domain-containing protein [Anaerolineae bacterium]HIQ01605.1 zinc ribbon domain-containing protein [Anaerolineales bacterium]
MPIYEYRCQKCGERFEKFVRSFSAQQTLECPRCGSDEVEKAVSLFGVGSSTHSSGAAVCSTGSV